MSDPDQSPSLEKQPTVPDPPVKAEATGAAEAVTAEPEKLKADDAAPLWRRCWRLGVLALLYVGLVGYFVITGLQEHSSTTTGVAQASSACAPGNVPTGTAIPAQLAPHGAQVESIAFGRGLSNQLREFEFSVTDPAGRLAGATCLPAHVNPFLRIGQAESAQLDPSRIDVAAAVSGQQVLVSVTMRRDNATFAPAGSYAGTISLVDPRIERVDIPLTVSMAYPIWRLPFVVLLLVLPIAIGYLWLLKGSFHAGSSNTTVITLWQFEDYAFSRNGILAIGAGAASAALVFSGTYLTSPTWGSSFVDAITLFGAMFAAFVAASTPVTAAGTDRSDSLSRTTPAQTAAGASAMSGAGGSR
jgi:hypothetical protein